MIFRLLCYNGFAAVLNTVIKKASCHWVKWQEAFNTITIDVFTSFLVAIRKNYLW